ncbi:hypothetical protein [Streptomyces sp. DASNCL29]|uniref:hypothetical protein n=1 Tax=Streptomyces sp. DASNCL29 TaxID=2583819 RepID=UPI00110F6BD5|nr:hypothetical protein [Streptomyces sp. DASNCL29]TMU89866.1 hypothetical protein FGK60_40180 [Streptomyces sp. DASNCL29]
MDKHEDHYLSKESKVSMQDLLDRSRSMRTTVAQVVAWLKALGIPVPDVGEKVRTALRRVPRA